MTIMVTGAKGMIGTQLVNALLEKGYKVIGIDCLEDESNRKNYNYFKLNLSEKEKLSIIADNCKVDRIIHLAALAHKTGESDLSWDRYKHINYFCSKNVFEIAGVRPVLFISTVDVFGFFDGKKPVSGDSPIHPISNYAKSKAMAEVECKKLEYYTIFRLSPVYSDTVKRDIQKRYYLKYPNVAYQIGNGTAFEVLNIYSAVTEMVKWCSQDIFNDVRIIKDDNNLWTPDSISAEKAEGRAKIVLYFPQWIVNSSYLILMRLFGENEKTYIINKAVHPLRSI